jgi:adenine C2-methylase RlmN of 23S rRNA A2503 and tRNA A37
MPVQEALERLKEYQDFSKKIVKIHHALIANENDSILHAAQICGMINKVGLRCEFNLVRYNPASPEQGEETDEEHRLAYLDFMTNHLDGKVQEIPRVGFDISASCGMFVE